MLIRIISHHWFALCAIIFAAVYFTAHILPAWQKIERDSWRKICDSTSMRKTAQGFCYTCQGAAHTFSEDLYQEATP